MPPFSIEVPGSLPLEILNSVRESVLVTTDVLSPPGPHIVYVNEAFTSTTGYEAEEVLGMTPRILQGHDTDRATLDRLKESLATRGEFRGTAINYRKNGEPFVNEWYIYSVVADGQRFFVSVQQEVSHLEAAQRNRHALMRGLISSNVALCIIDQSFRISVISDAFAAALGADSFTARGRFATSILDALTDEPTRIELGEALDRRHAWSGDLCLAAPDGRESMLAVQLVPLAVNAEDPEAPAFLCTGVDETQNRRFRAVADSIALANELAGAFGTLRHELGNPINNLSAALTVLRRTWSSMEPDSLSQLFEEMDDEVSRMKFLIRSLRGFSSNEALRREEFQLAAVVDNVSKLMRRQLRDASIMFTAEVAPTLMLFSDPRAMLQVMLNLCTNAVDAMLNSPKRELHVRAAEAEGGILIKVHDTGKGMDVETQEAATRAFYTSKDNGTGLGLSISRSLVSRMNGTLSIESNPGDGTTVTIWMAQRVRAP